MFARFHLAAGTVLLSAFVPAGARAGDLDDLARRCEALRVKGPKLQSLLGYAEHRVWKGLGLKAEAKYVTHTGDLQSGTAVVTLLRKDDGNTIKVPYGDLDEASKQSLRYIVSLRGELETSLQEAEEREAKRKGAPTGGGNSSVAPPAVQPPGPVVRLLNKATFDAAVGTRNPERLLQEIRDALQGREHVDLSAMVRDVQHHQQQAELRGAFPWWLHEHAEQLTAEFSKARTWLDATGSHKTEARLVAVTADSVTLAKADGAQVRVPLAKLGRASLSQIWALATCGVLLADLKPAELDASRVAQIAQCAEALDQRADLPKDLKPTIAAWHDRAKPRPWGPVEGRYLGTGKHDDGSSWIAVEKDDGQRVFCFAHELPATCRSTVKQLEASGDTILRAGRRFALELAQLPTDAKRPAENVEPAMSTEEPGPTPPAKEPAEAVPGQEPEPRVPSKGTDEPATAPEPTPTDPPEGGRLGLRPDPLAPAPEPEPMASQEGPAKPTPEESPDSAPEPAPAPEATPEKPAGAPPESAPARVTTTMRNTAKLVPAKLRSVMQEGEGEDVEEANAARASYLKLMGYCKAGWETRKLPVDHNYFKQPEEKKAALDLAANIVEKVLVWEGEDPDLRQYFRQFGDDTRMRDLTVSMTLQLLNQCGDATIFLGLPYEDVASSARSRLLKKSQANGWRPAGEDPPTPDAPPESNAP
jgi:hypothetical protein